MGVNSSTHNSQVSGIVPDDYEGIESQFTQVSELPSLSHCRLVKAMRYGRWHVLKGLKSEYSHDLAHTQRLRKEFELMMRLSHSGVLQAYDFERHCTNKDVGMDTFIVMEYVEGDTLDHWLESNPNKSQRRRVAHELLDAVEYIHKQGIVHRDLKPENIMITSNGANVKVIDFGLADNDSYALFKNPAGTEQYMAPEQMNTSTPDQRNDIYSLGLILQQLRLGWLYKSPIARCLQPIGKRYQCVEELKNNLHRRSRRFRTAAISSAIALTVGLSASIAAIIASRQIPIGQNNNILVDSLKHQLENTEMKVGQSQLGYDSLHHQLTGMNDSMALVNATNQQLRSELAERDARQKVIQQAIAEGIRRIDAMNASTHLKQHVDTLSSSKYLWVDWHYLCQRGRSKALPDYMLEIRDKFSIKELSEIQYALEEHCNHYESSLQSSIQQKGAWIYNENKVIAN